VNKYSYPNHPSQHGYMSEKIQRGYIAWAITKKLLPADAHRMAEVISLNAPSDPTKPIQFWQLFSVLGQDEIVDIVADFYQRVFAEKDWFKSVFERVGGVNHHVNTQASMWIDVMGGGAYYHGAEFRLNFHHTHNAMQLMNDKGAEKWSQLMVEALDSSSRLMDDDPRIRVSINTFLAHFMTKYADDFQLTKRDYFGVTNPAFKQKINFLRMSMDAIEALSEQEISAALEDQGVDISKYDGKKALVEKALMM
jgi:truncated hemoglobin YjbI